MVTKWKKYSYTLWGKSILVVLISICLGGIFLSTTFFKEFNYRFLAGEKYFASDEFRVAMNKFSLDAVRMMDYASYFGVEKGKEQYNEIYSAPNFIFVAVNTEKHKMVTNIEDTERNGLQNKIKYIRSIRYNLAFENGELDTTALGSSNAFKDLKEILQDKKYKFYAAVTEPLQRGDLFYSECVRYESHNPLHIEVIMIFGASLLIIGPLLLNLLIVTGKKEKSDDVYLMGIDKIPVELQGLCFSMILLMLVFGTDKLLQIYIQNTFENQEVFKGIIPYIFTLGIVDALVMLTILCSIIRNIKNKSFWKYSLVKKHYDAIQKYCTFIRRGYELIKSKGKQKIMPLFYLKHLKITILIGLFLYLFINYILIYLDIKFSLRGIFFLLFNGAISLVLLEGIVKFEALCEEMAILSRGEFKHTIDETQFPQILRPMANSINNLRSGLAQSVEKAVKSEQMKTELIANVSHDLKTPLTSIINYVGILKKEKLENKKAETYVEILEDKAQRLKQLIEDLVEATKVSTGNVAVKLEEIDLYQLVQQWIGEYDEKIQSNKLEIKLSVPEETPIVKADARHMWRITENLLGNAVKYSMPDSRIYISMNKENTWWILIIKNMSNHSLDITPEELMQRFVRGDKSRTTEGSGLGLSIAQNLTTLQGGQLRISIDGDLFKTYIKLPAAESHKICFDNCTAMRYNDIKY